MCLCWCHVNHWLYNNDLPCWFCERGREPWVARVDQSCQTCRHQVEREGRPPLCGLTRMRLPDAGTCCHWNTAKEPDAVLLLSDLDVAPGTLDVYTVASVADLFATTETAPPYMVREYGLVQVRLADLDVPLVYGVAAWGW